MYPNILLKKMKPIWELYQINGIPEPQLKVNGNIKVLEICNLSIYIGED